MGPSTETSARRLGELLRGRRTVVLTGAGCSTESGIPDYRGPDSPRKDRTPILYQQFLRSPKARARYWAGSAIGWPRVARARRRRRDGTGRGCRDHGRAGAVLPRLADALRQADGRSTCSRKYTSG